MIEDVFYYNHNRDLHFGLANKQKRLRVPFGVRNRDFYYLRLFKVIVSSRICRPYLREYAELG